jgi:hypothetical protein
MPENFTDAYKEGAFYAWYDNDKPGISKLRKLLVADDEGKIPSELNLGKWKKDLDWEVRAEGLDAQLSVVQDNKTITHRLEMFEKQAGIAEEMMDYGIAYLRENGITSDNAAINAITKGAQLMQISVGLAQIQVKIAGMTAVQLDKELNVLLGKMERDDVVDGDEISPDFITEETTE